MSISIGDNLPDATVLTMTDDGPVQVQMSDKFRGRKVVLFGLPGAYTGTCSTAHMPSFVRTRDQFLAKGVDEVICISVNDPFVTGAWGEVTGAHAAGITLLADAASEFTTAIGLNFSVPQVGFVNRSRRYAMLVEDGVVKIYNPEIAKDGCEISGGETLLAQI